MLPTFPSRGIEGPTRVPPQCFREAGVLLGEHSDHEESVIRKFPRGRADQLAQPGGSYHGVLVLAQKILELHETAQGALGRGAVNIGKKLDRVAQFLSADTSLVELLRRRRCGQALAPLHQLAMTLENEIGSGEENRKLPGHRALAHSALKRLGRALDQALDAPRREDLQHARARASPSLGELLNQRIQCFPITRVDRCTPFVELRQLNVEVTNVSAGPHPRPQWIEEYGVPAREILFEEADRGAHAAQRDTKIMQRFRIETETSRGLVLPNLKKVTAQNANSGFTDRHRRVESHRSQVENRLHGNRRGTKEIHLAWSRGGRHRARLAHRLEERGEVDVARLQHVRLHRMVENRFRSGRLNAPLLERQTRDR